MPAAEVDARVEIIHGTVAIPEPLATSATNMELKKNDWLIIGSFILITIIPLIIGLFDWGQKNYFMIVFFAGFIPIFSTHSTALGLRFKNPYFSTIWILMIVLNGLLYHRIIHLWISMIVSFLFYHLLRLTFKAINKEDPIPIFVGPGTALNYNEIENRMENKRDGLFTIISFFCGLFLSIYVLMITK
jgi:hypothetical protein